MYYSTIWLSVKLVINPIYVCEYMHVRVHIIIIVFMTQDEEMEGCTDGTWLTTGQAFFHCPPEKGLYYGFYNLKPDSRFNFIPLNREYDH